MLCRSGLCGIGALGEAGTGKVNWNRWRSRRAGQRRGSADGLDGLPTAKPLCPRKSTPRAPSEDHESACSAKCSVSNHISGPTGPRQTGLYSRSVKCEARTRRKGTGRASLLPVARQVTQKSCACGLSRSTHDSVRKSEVRC